MTSSEYDVSGALNALAQTWTPEGPSGDALAQVGRRRRVRRCVGAAVACVAAVAVSGLAVAYVVPRPATKATLTVSVVPRPSSSAAPAQPDADVVPTDWVAVPLVAVSGGRVRRPTGDIQPGAPIVSAHGLVGTADPSAATVGVTPLSAPGSSISVRRSAVPAERATVLGAADGSVRLTAAAPVLAFAVGERLVTRRSGTLPDGVPVGVVAAVTPAGVATLQPVDNGGLWLLRRAGEAAPEPVRGRSVTVSPTTLPADGGELAFTVHTETGVNASYGLTGDLDQLIDGQWRRVRTFGAALSFYGTPGTLELLGGQPGISDLVELVAHEGPGPLEWVRVGGLPPGSYRLRQAGGTGAFTVGGAATDPWPDRTGSSPQLIAAPAQISGSDEVRVTADVPTAGTDGALQDALGAPVGPARLERWTGHSWGPPVTLVTNDHPPAPLGNTREYAVTVPQPVETGTYRLLRTYTRAGIITGPLLETVYAF